MKRKSWHRNPSSDPRWEKRAAQLASFVVTPLRTEDIFFWAGERFGWSEVETRNVLAFAEDGYIYYREGLWYRFGMFDKEEKSGRQDRDGQVVQEHGA